MFSASSLQRLGLVALRAPLTLTGDESGSGSAEVLARLTSATTAYATLTRSAARAGVSRLRERRKAATITPTHMSRHRYHKTADYNDIAAWLERIRAQPGGHSPYDLLQHQYPIRSGTRT